MTSIRAVGHADSSRIKRDGGNGMSLIREVVYLKAPDGILAAYPAWSEKIARSRLPASDLFENTAILVKHGGTWTGCAPLCERLPAFNLTNHLRPEALIVADLRSQMRLWLLP